MVSRICAFLVFLLALGNPQRSAYVHGAVRLVNEKSTVPNAGQVEVWDPDSSQWATVCDRYWTFYDVQVACRELGYPGAALVKTDSFYGEQRLNRTIEEFVCDRTESTLLSCRNGGFFDKRCTSGTAGAVCTAPGYIGCYSDWKDSGVLRDHETEPGSLSVEKCLKICSKYMYRYAGVEDESKCYCGNEVFNYTQSDDTKCNDLCTGNTEQACGGFYKISIYDVQLGICEDPGVPDDGNYTLLQATNRVPFYFGTIIEFRCDDGFDIEGAPTIQCKRATNGSNSVAWSGRVPVCKGPETTIANFVTNTQQQQTGIPRDTQFSLGILAGSIIAVLGSVALAGICLVFWKKRGKRKLIRRESRLHGRAVGSLVAAVNPTYSNMEAIPTSLPPIYSQVDKKNKRNVGSHYENLPKPCTANVKDMTSEPPGSDAKSVPKASDNATAPEVESSPRSENEMLPHVLTKDIEGTDNTERVCDGDGQSDQAEGWVENIIYESGSM